tara:strand:- start:1095 stop:1445 length:351 start_codon:yes stop_codon:yes gene_type:complete
MKDELYDVVEKTIDYAFEGRYMLNMYEYLKSNKASRIVVEEFLMSCTATEVKNLVLDLEGYLEGGSDDTHKQLREGYGHLGKPEARKIKNYLMKILDDAERYRHDKRPGRKPRLSK